MGTGEYARSAATVKNFVRKRPQKGTKSTEGIFCAFCAFCGYSEVEYKLTDQIDSKTC